jgi:hypothetical protein
MLEKAFEDELIKLIPEEIVHFASTAEEAVQWIETMQAEGTSVASAKKQRTSLRHRKSILKRSSFFSAASYQYGRSFFSFRSSIDDDNDDNEADRKSRGNGEIAIMLFQVGLTFALGATFGVLACQRRTAAGR